MANLVRSPDAPAPFLKWAGGKSTLLTRLRPLLPPAHTVACYVEPFLGGGAVALDVLHRLRPRRAVLGDRNPALVEAWVAVRDDVEDLLDQTAHLYADHSPDHYLRVRAEVPNTPTARAARLLYLNKTCFNGLYRLNRSGGFNVPIGLHRPREVIAPDALRRVSQALVNVELVVGSFASTLALAPEADLVYLDPPYVPLSATASFTDYDGQPFGTAEHTALAEAFTALATGGARVILSNSNTPLVRALYAGHPQQEVSMVRRINASTRGRGRMHELLIHANPGR